LTIGLTVLLGLTDADNPFGINKLFLLYFSIVGKNRSYCIYKKHFVTMYHNYICIYVGCVYPKVNEGMFGMSIFLF